MTLLWGKGKNEMLQHNVLFQEEDRDVHVRIMLDGATRKQAAGRIERGRGGP